MASKVSYLVAEDPVVDLQIAEAMTQELEQYLVKDDLYRTLIVRTDKGDQNLQMSGGDLLSRLHRLQAVRSQLPPNLQTRIDQVTARAQTSITSLRSRFHERIRREMKARMDGLKWFLDDCAADRQRCRVEFPFEMRNRQRIEELVKALGGEAPPDLMQQLQTIDQRIRNATHAATFIWDDRLQAAFPAQPYWYLYVSP
jgi:hypothetical protein